MIITNSIGTYIKDYDTDILKNLTHIEFFREENSLNYGLKFHFKENKYFENDVISVKFFRNVHDEVSEKEGTIILWKDGKDITKKTIIKKSKNKKTGEIKIVHKEVQNESFFNLFKSLSATKSLDDDKVFLIIINELTIFIYSYD